MNPYLTPSTSFVSEEEFLTQTGVLSCFLLKHPVAFWAISAILLVGGLGGLAVFVGHP